MIYVIFNVHAYIDYVWFNHYFEKNYELLWTLIAVIYDAFGLLVTYNYSRKGLRLVKKLIAFLSNKLIENF